MRNKYEKMLSVFIPTKEVLKEINDIGCNIKPVLSRMPTSLNSNGSG